MKPSALREQIQRLLAENGFDPGPIDADFGPRTYAALQRLDLALDSEWHRVKATSFADPADVAAFRRCINAGNSERECFRVGDNGIGLWGDDTTADRPMCALPREDWEERWGDNARGKIVRVERDGRTVDCELRDTMPRRANIHNGAGIDLNPAACAALGLRPPLFATVSWAWVADFS